MAPLIVMVAQMKTIKYYGHATSSDALSLRRVKHAAIRR